MNFKTIPALAVAASMAASSFAYAGINDGPVPRTPVGTALGSAMLWAVINADGTVARADGTNSSQTFKLGTGQYQVYFQRNVQGCAYIATIGTASTGANNGLVSVAPRNPTSGAIPNAVYVETRSVGGTLADKPFHLFVNC